MSVGQLIRRALGPAFDAVARVYRGYYVDLGAFADELAGLGPISSVLEIGCGDGHLVEEITRVLPDASVLGIDVSENPGTLYKGSSDRVEFVQMPAEDLIEQGRVFDLVLLCDVLHHVPVDDRAALMSTAWNLVSETGYVAVKDWVASGNLATWLAFLSDTYITNDRPSFFGSLKGFEDVVLGEGRVEVAHGSVPPHQNNVFSVATRSDG